MKYTLLLAVRYLLHHRLRSAILTACITLVAFLPLSVNLLVAHYQENLTRRATATPLVLGAKGSRFDLLLSSLYFKGTMSDDIPLSQVEEIEEMNLALAIPLRLGHTARGYPIVGTTLDYFDFRGCRAIRGQLPAILGEVVLGFSVAEQLGLGPGDSIISDTEKLYDLSASYPLKMHISGVLEQTGSADDLALFVDIRTAWVIEGIGHGHQEVDESVDPSLVLQKKDGNISTNAAIVEYNEITEANLQNFHFHGGPELLPVSAVILVPPDHKSHTILRSRLLLSKSIQPLDPTDALSDLMDIVFRAKRFFDANLALVSVSTLLFMTLIIMLTLRVRQREIETLFRIGCARSIIFRLQAAELGIVITLGLSLAGVGAWAAYRVVIAKGWLL